MPALTNIVINFDSNVTKVDMYSIKSFTGTPESTITTSGSSVTFVPITDYYFKVYMNDGYIIDNVVAEVSTYEVNDITTRDTISDIQSNTFHFICNQSNTITITSKLGGTSMKKLTFDSNIIITVNGSSVTTSPYNLNNGDVITATTDGGYKIRINGTLHGGENTININNQDINIVRSTAETFDVLLVTINYTETSQVSIDLTSLSGWNNVSDGEHNIQVVAKADNYRDSEKSTAVSFTKGSSFTQVAVTLTNPFSSGISISASNAPFGRISNMNKTKIYSLYISGGHLGYLSYNGTKWSSTGVNVAIKSQTETTVDFYFGSGGETWSLHTVIALEGTTQAGVNDFTGYTATETLPEYICLVEGTLVTLADGTTKPIEDITYDDELLVWNFYDGKFDKAKPCWITKPQIAHEYNLCKFSNGVEIGFVGQGGDIGYHRIYNDEAKSFTHTGVDETPIGTHTFAQDGSKPTLIEQHIVNKQVRYYNVGTQKHINIFTNGILTSARISNKYAIKDMKYVGERLISEEFEQEYIRKTLKRC